MPFEHISTFLNIFLHILTFFDIFSLSHIPNLTARIEDGDSDFEADLWTRRYGCSESLIPVRPDRSSSLV